MTLLLSSQRVGTSLAPRRFQCSAAWSGPSWWTRRERRREQERVAARLLLGEASALRSQLRDARRDRRVLPDAGEHARRLLGAWRERPEELSALPIKIWDAVTMGVHHLYMLAGDADSVSNQEWSQRTDDVYRELEKMLAAVEGLVQGLADDSRSRRQRFSIRRKRKRSSRGA